jgi:Tripartite ATP-independent periplasmic transporter, DctM component
MRMRRQKGEKHEVRSSSCGYRWRQRHCSTFHFARPCAGPADFATQPHGYACWLTPISDNKYVFRALLNFALILVGMFIEPLPAPMLTAPLSIPVAKAFMVDPVHLGLIMVFNLVIGLYTPPVGGTLFVSAKNRGRWHGGNLARVDPDVCDCHSGAAACHLCRSRWRSSG